MLGKCVDRATLEPVGAKRASRVQHQRGGAAGGGERSEQGGRSPTECPGGTGERPLRKNRDRGLAFLSPNLLGSPL